jgi:hypothetical protein
VLAGGRTTGRTAIAGLVGLVLVGVTVATVAAGSWSGPGAEPMRKLSAVEVTAEPIGPPTALLAEPLPSPPGTTERVSVANNENQGNSGSGGVTNLVDAANGDQAISGDGRWVAFVSTATNLVPGGSQPGGLFLRDRQDGTTTAIPWINGEPFPAGVVAAEPAINGDGSVVAFTVIIETTLRGVAVVAGEATPYVLAWDRATGTELVSVDDLGAPAPGYQPTVSADGRYVAYTRWAAPAATPPPDTTGPVLSGLAITGALNCFTNQFCIFVTPGCGPPNSAQVGITATDPAGVSLVRLWYRYGFSGGYAQAALSQVGDRWTGTIDDGPNGAVQIDYFFEAFDTLGNRSSQTWTSDRVLRVEGCIL